MITANRPASRFGPMFSWDADTIRRLADQAVELAVKIGLCIEDDEQGLYLKEVESRGAHISLTERSARFSEETIRQTIDLLKQSSPAPAYPHTALPSARRPRPGGFSGPPGSNLLFDWDQWQARAIDSRDWIGLCQWAQGCDAIGNAGNTMPLQEAGLDPRLEPLYTYALTAKYSRKPYSYQSPTSPFHVKYLHAMTRTLQTRRGWPVQGLGSSHMEYLNSPFRTSVKSIATMVAGIDLGAWQGMGFGTMAVSGMNAPVTVVGTAVQAVAEVLAGLTLLRLLRPGHALSAFFATGNCDLRTAQVCYANVNACLQNLAALELLRLGFGANAGCLSYYRDANEPGLQALYEYSLAYALFSGVYGPAGVQTGGLACSNVYSPEQAVLDMEAAKEFCQFLHGFDADSAAVCAQDILQAGFKTDVHLTSEYTLAHLAEEAPFSQFFLRGLAGGSHHNRECPQTQELLNRAHETVLAAMAKGKETEPDVEAGNALFAQVQAAARELGVTVPPLA